MELAKVTSKGQITIPKEIRDILITGDKDFKDVDIDKPEILTPTEFFEKYIIES